MIKCEMGSVRCKGHKSIIKAELLTLLVALKEDKVLSEEDIKQCYEDSLKSEEQRHKETMDRLGHFSDMLDVLSAIVNHKDIDEETIGQGNKGI